MGEYFIVYIRSGKSGVFTSKRFENESEALECQKAHEGSILSRFRKAKHYLIVNNANPGLFWAFDCGNGEWRKRGSYYPSEEAAQADIDANGLDAHIEYDVW